VFHTSLQREGRGKKGGGEGGGKGKEGKKVGLGKKKEGVNGKKKTALSKHRVGTGEREVKKKIEPLSTVKKGERGGTKGRIGTWTWRGGKMRVVKVGGRGGQERLGNDRKKNTGGVRN